MQWMPAAAGALLISSCATVHPMADFCSLPDDLAAIGTVEFEGVVELLSAERLGFSGEQCLTRVSPITSGVTGELSALAIKAAELSQGGREQAVAGTFRVEFANVPLSPPRAKIISAQSLRLIAVHR